MARQRRYARRSARPASGNNLQRLHVLMFIEHGTRRMHIGGVTASPTGEWTVQQARNLALIFSERFSFGERFEDIKFLVHDRGSNFTPSFDAIFQAAGTRIVRTAVQAPQPPRQRLGRQDLQRRPRQRQGPPHAVRFPPGSPPARDARGLVAGLAGAPFPLGQFSRSSVRF